MNKKERKIHEDKLYFIEEQIVTINYLINNDLTLTNDDFHSLDNRITELSEQRAQLLKEV